MSGSKKTKIPEGKLIKAIAELEAEVAKGDPLEEADPEGGLSTEGKPLSEAAPKGRGESTKKSRAASSSIASAASSESGDDDGDDDDDDGSDEASSEPPPPFKGKKKVSKANASSDDDSGDDDDDDASKSFRQMAEGDETVHKGIIVNDFLEAMVDQLSLALRGMQKSIAKSFAGLEERLTAHIDGSIAKSAAGQQAFNVRLAKAVAAIGNTVQDDLLGMVDVVKSLADQPAAAPRGKAVLSKGEVNQPPWSGPGADQRAANGAGDFVAELGELSPELIGDWLFKKSANNQVDPKVIMAWEADRYNVEALPVQVRKALANDLIK